jgi:hypothetical protein
MKVLMLKVSWNEIKVSNEITLFNVHLHLQFKFPFPWNERFGPSFPEMKLNPI